MRAKIVLLAVALFFILGSFGLSAQEKYRIADIVFHIKGITRENALRRNAEIQVGREFASLEELKAYLADRQQVIINLRVIATAEITYSEKGQADGVSLVEVHVYTKDTWNILALPYLEYSSNTGIEMMIKARDYNFLGTMESLRANLYYYEQSGDFSLSVTLPLNFPMLGLSWTLTPSQGLDILGDDPDDDYYLSNGLGLSSKVPTALIIGHYPVNFTFGVSSDINYTLDPDKPISESRRGITAGFNHGLSNGRVDWKSNFRNGYSFSLGNTYEYNLYRETWSRAISFEAIFHRAFSPFGFSSRFYTFYNLDVDDEAGGPLRGILDKRMYGNLGLYVNTDLALKLWRWPKFFELQTGIFFDTGIAKAKEEAFDPEDCMFAGGMEVVVFPLFARSIYVRASFGLDLKAVLETRAVGGSYKREIFIGAGHHY